jgi:hypothetical protein
MPVAETLGQAAPFADMLGNVKDGVDHLQVADADIVALQEQAMFDSNELLGRDLDAQ